MTTEEAESIYKLPEYLGLGILNHNSIVRTEECVTANYTLGLDVVYSLEWTQAGCKLKEFYQGNSIASAFHENLNMAFFNILKHPEMKFYLYPPFLQLINYVKGAGNIFFAYPDMNRAYLYYPAGFIFILRQPIVDCNHDAWVRFQNDMERNAAIFPLQIDAHHSGAIYRLMDDGMVIREDTTIIYMSCLLRDFIESVELCEQSGLIPTEKEYRMIITDAPNKSHPLCMYAGDPSRSIQAFAVFEFGMQAGQIPAEQADELFTILARIWKNKETGQIEAEQADELFGFMCCVPPDMVMSVARRISLNT
jgi:hypothetical protein